MWFAQGIVADEDDIEARQADGVADGIAGSQCAVEIRGPPVRTGADPLGRSENAAIIEKRKLVGADEADLVSAARCRPCQVNPCEGRLLRSKAADEKSYAQSRILMGEEKWEGREGNRTDRRVGASADDIG